MSAARVGVLIGFITACATAPEQMPAASPGWVELLPEQARQTIDRWNRKDWVPARGVVDPVNDAPTQRAYLFDGGSMRVFDEDNDGRVEALIEARGCETSLTDANQDGRWEWLDCQRRLERWIVVDEGSDGTLDSMRREVTSEDHKTLTTTRWKISDNGTVSLPSTTTGSAVHR